MATKFQWQPKDLIDPKVQNEQNVILAILALHVIWAWVFFSFLDIHTDELLSMG